MAVEQELPIRGLSVHLDQIVKSTTRVPFPAKPTRRPPSTTLCHVSGYWIWSSMAPHTSLSLCSYHETARKSKDDIDSRILSSVHTKRPKRTR